MPAAAVSFSGLQSAVERQMLDGAAFEDVEAYIEERPLPAELKSALWLFAWSMQDRPGMMRRARETTASIAACYD